LCTGEDWNDICSPEDCPIDGIQNVSWEKKGVCRGGVNKTGLVEDRTCDPNLPICKSFNYSEWSECGQNFRRTRKVLHSYPLGCQGGNPELGEYCKYEYNVNDSLDNSDDENPVLVEDTGDSSTQSGSSSRDTSELDEILSELSLTENELQVVKSGTKLEAKSSLIDFRDVLENKLLVLGVLSFVLIVILISVVILLRGRR